MPPKSSHKFQEKTFTKLTYCDYCTKLLWGVAKQGVTCEGCQFNCHKKCSELVYDNCIRSMYTPSPDDLKRSATTGPGSGSGSGGSAGTKTGGTTTSTKKPRRLNSDGGMHVMIPPAIVSSSQPMQSLVEKTPKAHKGSSEQDSEAGQGKDKEKVASPTTSKTGFLEDAIISAAIRMSLPGDISSLPKNHHPPLTIQATTINFTRFVHKTTGLFWFQDRIEDIFTWKDPWNTTFVLVLYCFICIYPILLFLLPQAIMATIMIYFLQQKSTRQQQKILGLKPTKQQRTQGLQQQSSEAYIEAQEKRHHNRYHVYHDEDYLEQDTSSDDEEQRRSAGVQYLSNLQHIQNMMGDVSDAHDVLKPLFRHLDWSDEAEATMIVQGTIIAFVGMSIIMWFIPWRWVFMFGGAGGMLANSPWGKIIIKEMGPLTQEISGWVQEQGQSYKEKKIEEES